MTGLWVTAGFVPAACIAGIAVWWFRDRRQEAAWRREDDQLAVAARGRHRAPKPRPAAVTVRADRAIKPAVTGHAPPWEDAPAAVIEATAVTQGPPDQPVTAPGDWVWTAVWSGGQVTELRAAVMPPVDLPSWPGELHPKVAAQLGHATTSAAVDSMSAQWHSVESIFNGADVRQVRKKLAGGAS